MRAHSQWIDVVFVSLVRKHQKPTTKQDKHHRKKAAATTTKTTTIKTRTKLEPNILPSFRITTLPHIHHFVVFFFWWPVDLSLQFGWLNEKHGHIPKNDFSSVQWLALSVCACLTIGIDLVEIEKYRVFPIFIRVIGDEISWCSIFLGNYFKGNSMEIHDLANERIELTVFVCADLFRLRRARIPKHSNFLEIYSKYSE